MDSVVHVDAPKIARVLRNFLSNAFKFTGEGDTVTVRLKYIVHDTLEHNAGLAPMGSKRIAPISSSMNIDSKQKEVKEYNFVRVEVVDSGPGISAEDIPKIFNTVIQINANELQVVSSLIHSMWEVG